MLENKHQTLLISEIISLIILFRAVHHDDYPGNSSSEALHEAHCRFIRHFRYHRMLPFWPNIANAIWKHVAYSLYSTSASNA